MTIYFAVIVIRNTISDETRFFKGDFCRFSKFPTAISGYINKHKKAPANTRASSKIAITYKFLRMPKLLFGRYDRTLP